MLGAGEVREEVEEELAGWLKRVSVNPTLSLQHSLFGLCRSRFGKRWLRAAIRN